MSIRDSIRDARTREQNARQELDQAADDMIAALLPRLRLVTFNSKLKALKRALRAFDAKRCKWRPA